MSISEAMEQEYFCRYNKVFLPFRNPIDIKHWQWNTEGYKLNSSEIPRIVHTGRIFHPVFESLIDTCKVIDNLNRKNKKIFLDIYTFNKNPSFLKRVKKYTGIRIMPPIDYEDMPQHIRHYEIFLLCEDFNNQARKYLKFSLSTRASEGMISGIPVLIYAPRSNAIYKYFEITGSGCLVGQRNLVKLEEAIIRLLSDRPFTEQIIINAARTAKEDSNGIIVREEFRKALSVT
jgi:glycosyltransferase involved in cell wall biosynthesis